MRRFALFAFSVLFLGAVLPIACTQNFNQFEPSGGTGASGSTSSSGTTATTTSSSSSSSTSGMACSNPETDCPPTGTKCQNAACSASHKCEVNNAGMGEACTDNGGKVCDGMGHCVACLTPSDCPMQATACIVDTCNNNACGTANEGAGTTCTDMNGKVCDGNGHCVGCNGDGDCQAPDRCMGNMCVSPTCMDGVKDGSETDTDCGGSMCPACGNGKSCSVASDCKSGFCNSGTCVHCGQDGDCQSGFYCQGMGNGATCTAQSAQGMHCMANDQCTSGFCVDGFCCDQACNGGCQACSNMLKGAGSDGVCGDIKVGTDPKNACTDQGQATCGHDGVCDGNGACQFYAVGSQCAAAGCANGQMNSARMCDGMGTCQPPMSTSCSPYAGCNGNMCASSCATDTDCASNNWCNTMNHCVASQADGAACTGGDGRQCQSGFCANNECCTSACNGTCQLCGNNGVCGPAPAGTMCSTGVCNGTGMGASACVQCASNTQCMGMASTPVCNVAMGKCVQCTTNANCSAPTPVCDVNVGGGTCEQCTQNADCNASANKICDTMADAQHDTCVQCDSNTDCPAGMPTCTNHTCM